MAGTHTGILLHVIFSTKLRYPLLHDDWRDELFAYIGGTITEHKGSLLRAGGIEDHVHLLIKIHPSFAIADTIRLIKSNSSRWISEQRKLGHRFEWQRGYGAFSVSQSMSNKVKAYLDGQREHHQKHSFRDEYLSILRRHAIEFDERYVFEEEVVS